MFVNTPIKIDKDLFDVIERLAAAAGIGPSEMASVLVVLAHKDIVLKPAPTLQPETLPDDWERDITACIKFLRDELIICVDRDDIEIIELPIEAGRTLLRHFTNQ